MFGASFARHVATRYRRRGLDGPSRRMVEWLAAQGIEGASVLEIGGGVGEIQLELLRRGAARSTNLELSPAYDAEAAALAAEAGVADRVERRLGDVAVNPDAAEPADVVVMHRVVCCYPDVEALVGAAAEHARRAVVFTHPPRNIVSRAMLRAGNLGFQVMGREYRAFVHSPAVMARVLEEHGFAVRHLPSGPIWHVLAATRTTGDAGRAAA